MAKATKFEDFVDGWEVLIPTLSLDDLRKYLAEASPSHPNENMRWLYDRLLAVIAFKEHV